MFNENLEFYLIYNFDNNYFLMAKQVYVAQIHKYNLINMYDGLPVT